MLSKCFVGWRARVVVVVEAVKRKSSFAFDENDDETWNVLRKRKENFLYRSPLTHPFGVWNSIRCVLVCIVTWSTSRLMTNAPLGLRWKCLEVKFSIFKSCAFPALPAFPFSIITLCARYITSDGHAATSSFMSSLSIPFNLVFYDHSVMLRIA